jgi:hypothetical protein
MITVDGVEYGTADELAAVLGPDVNPDLIRSWARRGRITRHHRPGQGRGTTWYRLDQVTAAELATRNSRRGRPRLLDMSPLGADDLSVPVSKAGACPQPG